jgi:O-antigen/teichoic acid export membrane protein
LLLSLRIAAVINIVGTCLFIPIGVVAIRPRFGCAIGSAAAPFALLGLVSCTQTVVGPLNSFAFATRSAPHVLRINVVSLAVDAILAVSLIPLLGVWGAVIANGCAQTVSLCWLAALVANRLGVKLRQILRALPLFLLGAALGAAEAATLLTLRRVDPLLVVPVLLLGLVLLRACLLRFRQLRLTNDDVRQLSRTSSARAMHLLLRALTRVGVAEA